MGNTKLSEAQQIIVESLKEGWIINYFRGIGTRYTPSATLEHKDRITNRSVSVATVKALRNKNYLEEFDRESYHSKYRLKTQLS